MILSWLLWAELCWALREATGFHATIRKIKGVICLTLSGATKPTEEQGRCQPNTACTLPHNPDDTDRLKSAWRILI